MKLTPSLLSSSLTRLSKLTGELITSNILYTFRSIYIMMNWSLVIKLKIWKDFAQVCKQFQIFISIFSLMVILGV